MLRRLETSPFDFAVIFDHAEIIAPLLAKDVSHKVVYIRDDNAAHKAAI